MSHVPEIQRLGTVIDIIARKCWHGFPALMGKKPEPSREQPKSALALLPSKNALTLESVDNIFRFIGWANIVKAVQAYAKKFPVEWRMYVEYVMLKETGRAEWGGGALFQSLRKNTSCRKAALARLYMKFPIKLLLWQA